MFRHWERLVTQGKTKTVRGEHIPPLFGSACKKKKNGGCFFDIDFSYNSEVRGGLNEGLQFKIGPSWDE